MMGEAEAALVIPFETAVAAEVEQEANSHYLACGQAAGRKPGSFFASWQAMGFKSLAKVIDIAIDSGYSIFVHKKPLPFPVCYVFGLCSIPDSGGGFFILSNSR
jgi:hypothetical protein